MVTKSRRRREQEHAWKHEQGASVDQVGIIKKQQDEATISTLPAVPNCEMYVSAENTVGTSVSTSSTCLFYVCRYLSF